MIRTIFERLRILREEWETSQEGESPEEFYARGRVEVVIPRYRKIEELNISSYSATMKLIGAEGTLISLTVTADGKRVSYDNLRDVDIIVDVSGYQLYKELGQPLYIRWSGSVSVHYYPPNKIDIIGGK